MLNLKQLPGLIKKLVILDLARSIELWMQAGSKEMQAIISRDLLNLLSASIT